jgi:branched-chain amino acid transport system permease protein
MCPFWAQRKRRSVTRRSLITVILAGVALALVLPALPASAQGSGEAVTGTISYEDPESGDRTPAAGVSLTVADEAGTELGLVATDSEGVFLFELPGPGSYSVLLDEDTLPEGVALRNPDRNPATVRVETGQTGRTIFATVAGEGGGSRSDITTRRVAQLTVEGLKLGLFLGIAAIGLSLIFGTTGLVNFAHGEMLGWGMLIAYLFNFYGLAGIFGFMEGWPAPFGAGMNLVFAVPIAIAAGGAAGYLFDRLIFAPLRRLGASLIAQLVVTIGLSIAIRYIFLFAFRGTPRFFRDFTAQTAIKIGIIEITPKDLLTAVLSILVLIGVGLFLETTRVGKAMRAVADNRDLAESSGINVQWIIRIVWIMGGALAALGGVFIGLSEQVSWNIGFRILLLIFASVILGGLGTAYGALVGAVIVGVGIQVSTLFVPTELKNVGALVVLVVVLVIRPQGILGKRERVG